MRCVVFEINAEFLIINQYEGGLQVLWHENNCTDVKEGTNTLIFRIFEYCAECSVQSVTKKYMFIIKLFKSISS